MESVGLVFAARDADVDVAGLPELVVGGLNEAESGALSTMASVLGRMCTYSGKEISWDEALNHGARVTPENMADLAWDSVPPTLPDENGAELHLHDGAVGGAAGPGEVDAVARGARLVRGRGYERNGRPGYETRGTNERQRNLLEPHLRRIGRKVSRRTRAILTDLCR